VTEKLE